MLRSECECYVLCPVSLSGVYSGVPAKCCVLNASVMFHVSCHFLESTVAFLLSVELDGRMLILEDPRAEARVTFMCL